MSWTRLVVLDLGPGEVYAHECGESEWIVLPLSGGCEVRCRGSAPGPAPQTPAGLNNRGSAPGPAPQTAAGLNNRGSAPGPAPQTPAGLKDRGGAPAAEPHVFELRGRSGVFGGGPTDFAYVPRDAHAEIRSAAGGRFALAGARCERRLTPGYGPAEAVAVELRGAGQCSRQVNNFAAAGPDGFDCDRLIAVEVLTPGGNWSSYPPHKHDEHHPGEESRLEEIYYFEIAPHGDTPGLGYQRVTPSPAGKTDILTEVRTGDAVLIPDGWHGPSIAAPGHDMYYLNVMAGPGGTREWLIRDHPDHGWIRGTWDGQDIDPRLPFPRAEDHR
ncbi:5-deoxy-glucuronate isomerase [Streptomyces sp. NBC_01294]|uniref:5-deoxy-glucuronate isomerase n=1 Tax=Streptomyces sp. NBC_01294 TaxID=2903815 RepID=UPI002DD8406A|nr:5-deoxy-glucuronate isomerase [Streptomyces sp. NBC_01294]WRZ61969.1 5-deoxy-glucuronate isomerase [Streptomyces sp. NBC_01294]